MRGLLVTHRQDRFTFGNSFVSAILRAGEFSKQEVEDGWTLDSPESYDAILFFVKFRELREQPGINWGSFAGPRALLDLDAFHDYGGWWGSPYIGQWTLHARRLGFDLLVVSGMNARDHFLANGFDSAMLPKGYSAAEFFDLGGPRSGIGHFGTTYRARAAMLHHLERANISFTNFRVPHAELNATLNNFTAMLVCNMTSKSRFGKIGRFIERRRPGVGLILGPAPEPMIKNFEAAASGCAVFMDETPELEDLGFVDGETAIIYRTFDELVDKIHYWSERPEALRKIGAASAALCSKAHTWDIRAQELHKVLLGRTSENTEPT